MTLVLALFASLDLPTMMGNHLKKSFEMALDQFWTTTLRQSDLRKEGWGEKKIIQQDHQPNCKEYLLPKTGRAGLRRGMALPVTGARALEYSEAGLGITGSASGTEPGAHLDPVSQPPLPSPYGLITPARP